MKDKKRMKPRIFIKKYWRLILGGAIIAAVVFCSIFAPLLTDFDPEFVDMDVAKALPGEGGHLLGTDALGRDVWSVCCVSWASKSEAAVCARAG